MWVVCQGNSPVSPLPDPPFSPSHIVPRARSHSAGGSGHEDHRPPQVCPGPAGDVGPYGMCEEHARAWLSRGDRAPTRGRITALFSLCHFLSPKEKNARSDFIFRPPCGHGSLSRQLSSNKGSLSVGLPSFARGDSLSTAESARPDSSIPPSVRAWLSLGATELQ